MAKVVAQHASVCLKSGRPSRISPHHTNMRFTLTLLIGLALVLPALSATFGVCQNLDKNGCGVFISDKKKYCRCMQSQKCGWWANC